jgi:hypothetical protein
MATPQMKIDEEAQPVMGWPREVWYDGQIKYELDPSTPKWKVWFFFHVYLNFVRFCHFKLKLPTIRVLDKDGRPGWLEDQSIWPTKEEAETDARRFPFGFVKRMPFRAQAPASTYQFGEYEFPNSPAKAQYEGRELDVVGVRRGELKVLRQVTSSITEKLKT